MNDELFFSTTACSEYLFKQLLARGMGARLEDCEEIADVFFDYLEELGIIVDVEEDGV